jgi:hypothetical protein
MKTESLFGRSENLRSWSLRRPRQYRTAVTVVRRKELHVKLALNTTFTSFSTFTGNCERSVRMKMVPKLRRHFLIFLNRLWRRTHIISSSTSYLLISFYPFILLYTYISYLLLLAFLIFLSSPSFSLASHILLTLSLSHFSCQTDAYTSNLTMQLPTNTFWTE